MLKSEYYELDSFERKQLRVLAENAHRDPIGYRIFSDQSGKPKVIIALLDQIDRLEKEIIKACDEGGE